MNNRLVIIGAGGQGRVCAEAASLNGYDNIVFLDDRPVNGINIIDSTDNFEKYISDSVFFVAIGDNRIRADFICRIRRSGGQIITIIHPGSVVSASAKIGAGTVVMAGAVVQADAVIGDGVILNTCSSVDHDCVIGNYSHVAVGARLAGAVMLGDYVFAGANCAVSNNLSITDNCIIGAGTAVICNLTKAGTYVGVPARRVK